MDKQQIMNQLRRALSKELQIVEVAQRRTAEGVTHEESRAENDKDTRGLESSYLARGQANRVVDLRDDLAKLDGLVLRSFGEGEPIALSALIFLEADADEGEKRVYFMAPAGGGERLLVSGVAMRVITPGSPVGRALLGRHVGDDVDLRSPGGASSWVIDAVE